MPQTPTTEPKKHWRRRQRSIALSLGTAPSSSTSIPETISRATHTTVTSHSHQHISPSHPHRKSPLLPSSPRPPVNRLEEWKQGHLTGIPHILLIHTSSAVPDRPIMNQSSVLHLVLRAHLSRVSSMSMLTGVYILQTTLQPSQLWWPSDYITHTAPTLANFSFYLLYKLFYCICFTTSVL